MITLYPVGDNKSSARSTFDNRKFYKEEVYPNYITDPIDYWYEDIHYGRINSNNDVVKLSSPEDHLKQILGVEEPHFALKFVVDAYEDFLLYINAAVTRGVIDKGARIAHLAPARSWENPDDMYDAYMVSVRDSFYTFLGKNSLEDKVKNIDDFGKFFLRYTDTISTKFPITQTAFIKSKYSSPQISGLSIELNIKDHAIDSVKLREFISESCYEFYVIAAKKHGFLVDKNAPWRITANLASPRMQEYMNYYGVKPSVGNSSNMFDIFYEATYNTDIILLKSFIQQSYNVFVERKPFVKKFIILSCGKKTRKRISERKKDTSDDPVNKFNWNKLYYRLRIFEENKAYREEDLKHILKKAHELEKTFNISDGIRYINHKIKS